MDTPCGPHHPVRLALLRVEFADHLGVDGFGEGVLAASVDGGGDAVAALGEGFVVEDLVIDDVVLDGFHQVSALPGQSGGGADLARLGEPCRRAIGGGQPVLLDHAVEYVVPAGEGAGAALGVGDDVEGAGGVEEGGEVGALGGGEVGGVLAVVGLGGGLDAVGVAAEVTGVQIPLQDVVLRLLATEFDRDEELLDLPFDRLFLAQVVVLDVLLGDGRTGLGALAGRGVPGGADHRLGIHGPFGVEVPVLGSQYGLLHGPGDL